MEIYISQPLSTNSISYKSFQMVGWRNASRKLLLYLSDAGFHFAGDGLVTVLHTKKLKLVTSIVPVHIYSFSWEE